MNLTQHWQHEETGIISDFPIWKYPGRRWYKIKLEDNMDIKPGFYWASTSYNDDKWFNYIVEVYGSVPFLKLRVWDRQNDAIINDVNPSTIKHWGPRIEEPKIGDNNHVG